MNLPPHVIIRQDRDFGVDAKGEKRVLYLGAVGWTPNRKDALSFTTPEEAKDWIASASKQSPAMFKGTNATTKRVEFDPKLHEPQFTLRAESPVDATLDDYDPYERA